MKQYNVSIPGTICNNRISCNEPATTLNSSRKSIQYLKHRNVLTVWKSVCCPNPQSENHLLFGLFGLSLICPIVTLIFSVPTDEILYNFYHLSLFFCHITWQFLSSSRVKEKVMPLDLILFCITYLFQKNLR